MSTDNFVQKCFRQSDKIVGRSIGGEYVLVPILETASEVDCIFNLNGVASRVWDLLDGVNKVGVIESIIATEFEVTPDILRADLESFFAQLEHIGATVEV
jgi:hypothetical protein